MIYPGLEIICKFMQALFKYFLYGVIGEPGAKLSHLQFRGVGKVSDAGPGDFMQADLGFCQAVKY